MKLTTRQLRPHGMGSLQAGAERRPVTLPRGACRAERLHPFAQACQKIRAEFHAALLNPTRSTLGKG